MKKLLIGLAAVLVVLIVAVIAVPFLVPVATYKGKIVALVKETTGRDLRIDGPMKLSLFPNLAIEATDVSLSNAPGAAAKDMVRLKTLDVTLALWPLLHGVIAVDHFVLIDPVIALEVDKNGQPNWVFHTAATQPGTTAPRPAAPAPRAKTGGAASGVNLASLRLGNVRLVNGTVSYLDQRSGKRQTVTGIDMALSLPDLASPFTADGSAVWNGEKLTLSLALAKPGALSEGGTSPVSLKLASAPVTLDFQGEASGATLSKIAGTVDLKAPSLRRLAHWAGSPMAATGSGLGPLAIKGKLDIAGEKIAFSDADLALDDIKGQGALALDTSGARPYLKGHLTLAALDLNPYLPPETQGATPGPAPAPPPTGAGKPAAPASGWSEAPLDLSGLKLADADFDLTAGSLVYRKITIGKSALALHLKDGRLVVDLSELALYQGKGQGKVVADGSGAVPRLEVSLTLSSVQVGPLLKDAADIGWLNGTGAFDVAVSGQGRSERELVGALNGKGSLNLANGQIKGVNLVSMIKNVATALAGGQQSGGDTGFATLSATYTITNGILRSDDLQLKSAEIPMKGAGTVNLPQRSVDFRVTPQLAGVLAVPIMIRGPWNDLRYQPDLSKVVTDPSKLLGGALSGGQNGGSGKGAAKPLDVLKGLLGK